jgi:hypothetical protein
VTKVICVQMTGNGKGSLQYSFDGTCPNNWSPLTVYVPGS